MGGGSTAKFSWLLLCFLPVWACRSGCPAVSCQANCWLFFDPVLPECALRVLQSWNNCLGRGFFTEEKICPPQIDNGWKSLANILASSWSTLIYLAGVIYFGINVLILVWVAEGHGIPAVFGKTVDAAAEVLGSKQDTFPRSVDGLCPEGPLSSNSSCTDGWVVLRCLCRFVLTDSFILQILHSALQSPISLLPVFRFFANFLTVAFKCGSLSLCVPDLYDFTRCRRSVWPPSYFHIKVWS